MLLWRLSTSTLTTLALSGASTFGQESGGSQSLNHHWFSGSGSAQILSTDHLRHVNATLDRSGMLRDLKPKKQKAPKVDNTNIKKVEKNPKAKKEKKSKAKKSKGASCTPEKLVFGGVSSASSFEQGKVMLNWNEALVLGDNECTRRVLQSEEVNYEIFFSESPFDFLINGDGTTVDDLLVACGQGGALNCASTTDRHGLSLEGLGGNVAYDILVVASTLSRQIFSVNREKVTVVVANSDPILNPNVNEIVLLDDLFNDSGLSLTLSPEDETITFSGQIPEKVKALQPKDIVNGRDESDGSYFVLRLESLRSGSQNEIVWHVEPIGLQDVYDYIEFDTSVRVSDAEVDQFLDDTRSLEEIKWDLIGDVPIPTVKLETKFAVEVGTEVSGTDHTFSIEVPVVYEPTELYFRVNGRIQNWPPSFDHFVTIHGKERLTVTFDFKYEGAKKFELPFHGKELVKKCFKIQAGYVTLTIWGTIEGIGELKLAASVVLGSTFIIERKRHNVFHIDPIRKPWLPPVAIVDNNVKVTDSKMKDVHINFVGEISGSFGWGFYLEDPGLYGFRSSIFNDFDVFKLGVELILKPAIEAAVATDYDVDSGEYGIDIDLSKFDLTFGSQPKVILFDVVKADLPAIFNYDILKLPDVKLEHKYELCPGDNMAISVFVSVSPESKFESLFFENDVVPPFGWFHLSSRNGWEYEQSILFGHSTWSLPLSAFLNSPHASLPNGDLTLRWTPKIPPEPLICESSVPFNELFGDVKAALDLLECCSNADCTAESLPFCNENGKCVSTPLIPCVAEGGFSGRCVINDSECQGNGLLLLPNVDDACSSCCIKNVPCSSETSNGGTLSGVCQDLSISPCIHPVFEASPCSMLGSGDIKCCSEKPIDATPCATDDGKLEGTCVKIESDIPWDLPCEVPVKSADCDPKMLCCPNTNIEPNRCSYGSFAGECIHKQACKDIRNGVPIPGHCPNDIGDVQCCFEDLDTNEGCFAPGITNPNDFDVEYPGVCHDAGTPCEDPSMILLPGFGATASEQGFACQLMNEDSCCVACSMGIHPDVECCTSSDCGYAPREECSVDHKCDWISCSVSLAAGEEIAGDCVQSETDCGSSEYGFLDAGLCPDADRVGSVCCMPPIQCTTIHGGAAGTCMKAEDCSNTGQTIGNSDDCPYTLTCCHSTSQPDCIMVDWIVQPDQNGLFDENVWMLLHYDGISQEGTIVYEEYIGTELSTGSECFPRNGCYYFFFLDNSPSDEYGFDFVTDEDAGFEIKADGAVVAFYNKESDPWPQGAWYYTGGSAGFGEDCKGSPCAELGGECVRSISSCASANIAVQSEMLCPNRPWEESFCCLEPIECTSSRGNVGQCGSYSDCDVAYATEYDFAGDLGCSEHAPVCCTSAPNDLSNAALSLVGASVYTIRFEPSYVEVRLTDALPWQLGAAWSVEEFQVFVTRSFSFRFQALFGDDTAGGDGIVFALHNGSPSVIGGTGGHFLAYDGITNSLAVEFDTWPYPTPDQHPDGEDRNEITPDHIAILENGDILNPAAGPVSALPSGNPIDDGTWHDILIQYDVSTGSIIVFFDDESSPRLTYGVGNLEQFLGSNKVTWGFTAATGNDHNRQSVRLPFVDYLVYEDQ